MTQYKPGRTGPEPVAPREGSTTPSVPRDSLLEIYQAWKARQATVQPPAPDVSQALKAGDAAARKAQRKAAKRAARYLRLAQQAAALAGPELETRALRCSLAAHRKYLDLGPDEAARRAHVKYRAAGGSGSLAAWRRKTGL